MLTGAPHLWSHEKVFVVRTLPGHLSQRHCLKDTRCEPAEFSWHERRPHADRTLANRAQIDALSHVLPDLGDLKVCLPSRSHDLTIWGGLPISGIFFDQLFGGELPGLPGLGETSAAIGRGLARLHGTVLQDRDPTIRRLPMPPWVEPPLDTDSYDGDLRRLRSGLRARLPPIPDARWDAASALVHGRPTSRDIVPSTSPLLLGWGEAGIGNPAADLGCLVAEFLEAQAIAGIRRPLIEDALTHLLWSYREELLAGPHDTVWDPDQVMAWVIERLAHHLALHCATAGRQDNAYRLASIIRDRLRVLKGTLHGQ